MNTNQQNWKQKLGVKPFAARSIDIIGVLMALEFAISPFSFYLIPQVLRVGFAFIPVTIRSFLFGPVASAGAGALMDVIKFYLNPNSGANFHLGFTFTAALAPFIYGLVLYKKPLTWQRLLVANVLVGIIVNMVLNTYWIAQLQNIPFVTAFATRFPLQVALIAVHTVVMWGLTQASPVKKILERFARQF